MQRLLYPMISLGRADSGNRTRTKIYITRMINDFLEWRVAYRVASSH